MPSSKTWAGGAFALISTVPPRLESHGWHRSAAFRLQKRATDRRHRIDSNGLSISAFLQPKGRAPVARWYDRDVTRWFYDVGFAFSNLGFSNHAFIKNFRP